jgi:hypothetical protein
MEKSVRESKCREKGKKEKSLKQSLPLTLANLLGINK